MARRIPAHHFRRGNIFYFRQVIPADLREHFLPANSAFRSALKNVEQLIAKPLNYHLSCRPFLPNSGNRLCQMRNHQPLSR
ncbi:DUF6538 domain-containing protein [Vogesella fluminis]|uniref:DUF6538 domain-containing protein n=1 Tax=Vogesella fluminis TaxID=1069161 RepID=UPI0036374CC0